MTELLWQEEAKKKENMIMQYLSPERKLFRSPNINLFERNCEPQILLRFHNLCFSPNTLTMTKGKKDIKEPVEWRQPNDASPTTFCEMFLPLTSQCSNAQYPQYSSLCFRYSNNLLLVGDIGLDSFGVFAVKLVSFYTCGTPNICTEHRREKKEADTCKILREISNRKC